MRFVMVIALLLTVPAFAQDQPDYARFGGLAAEAKYCGRQDLAEDLIFAFFWLAGFQETFSSREARFLAAERRDWAVLCARVEEQTPVVLARYFTYQDIPFRELPDNLLPLRRLGEVTWRGMGQWERGPVPVSAEVEAGGEDSLRLRIGRDSCEGRAQEIPRSDPYRWTFVGVCSRRGEVSGELALDRSSLTALLRDHNGEGLRLSLIPED